MRKRFSLKVMREATASVATENDLFVYIYMVLVWIWRILYLVALISRYHHLDQTILPVVVSYCATVRKFSA